LPVLAEGCDKTTYNVRGSASVHYDAACRKSTNVAGVRTYIGTVNDQPYGDLFSWCAVVMLADLLCPAPWRVPTCRDFVELDIALGGTGSTATNAERRDRYIANTTNDGQSWFGGGYGGLCLSGGTLSNQTTWASYWSQTEGSATIARSLNYDSNGTISPQDNNPKNTGFALRCVR